MQIKGTLTSSSNGPLLGVTVFNNNSLEGTITNEKGVFFIDVMAGDEISFSALQYKAFSVAVTDNTIKDRSIKLSIQEDIEQLEVITITGKSVMIPVERLVAVDAQLDKVSTRNINTKAVDRMENTFSNRIRRPEEYAINHTAAQQSAPRFNVFGASTQINVSNINQALHPAQFSADNQLPKEEDPIVLLKNKFEKKQLLELINLPEEDYTRFLYFTKDQGLSKELVNTTNELELIDFLKKVAVQFKGHKP